MTVELIVPTLGESITEATVSKWLKKVGEPFETDEPLVEIETDKVTVEVPAPSAGVLTEIKVQVGNDVSIGGVLGIIGKNSIDSANKTKDEKKEFASKSPQKHEDKKGDKSVTGKFWIPKSQVPDGLSVTSSSNSPVDNVPREIYKANIPKWLCDELVNGKPRFIENDTPF